MRKMLGLLKRKVSSRFFKGFNLNEIELFLTRRYFNQAANELGIACNMLGDEVMEFVLDGRRRRICELWTDLDTLPTGRIASNKPLCSSMLKKQGQPVPEFIVFPATQKISEVFSAIEDKFSSKIVVKPATGTSSGHGVDAGIDKNEIDRIKRAVLNAGRWSSQILVEEFVEGENYRFLVCRGEVLSVVHRQAPFVVGDGKRTLGKLIKDENLQRKEKLKILQKVYTPPVLMPINVDSHFLECQQYKLDQIVPDGTRVFCRQETNWGTGGMYREVTAVVHPQWLVIASEAASIIGINLAGIDIICTDITLPVEQTRGKINEVNTTPGLAAHYEIMNQELVIPVAKPVLSAMFDLQYVSKQ